MLVIRKKPFISFQKNLLRIASIQAIQKDLESINVNKRGYKIWFLNQAYHLHLVAHWQVYIQEQVEWVSDEIMKGETKNNVMVTLLEKNRLDFIKKFSTPNKENIKKLFQNCTGIIDVTEHWSKCERYESDVSNKLKNILDTRNEIAHAARSSVDLDFDFNQKNMMFLSNLAYATSFSCERYVADIKQIDFRVTFELPYAKT